ncbi:MAG: FAD-binding oxidoreductase [Myxococcota bacterium]
MPSVTYEGAVYEVRENESVLDALLRGGADVDFSCRRGSCQTCLLRVTQGDPGETAQKHMRKQLVDSDHFMPCICHPADDLELAPADLSELTLGALVASKEDVSPTVVKLLVEPEITLDWTPGQYVNVHRDDGVVRSYSIASIAEQDYYMEFHVKRVEDGQLSNWLHDDIGEGDFLTIQGPLGDCIYNAEFTERDLVLLGTGTGVSPLWGIARDALARGHQGAITLYHGARTQDELYQHRQLLELDAEHEQFNYVPCISGDDVPAEAAAGRVTEVAFPEGADYEESIVYLCGNPDMVYDARCKAVLAGVVRRDIFADPFESGEPYMPDDKAKLSEVETDPEMWEALDHGKGLREILEDFYDRAYQDPRLSPYFHNVTKQRAISKQYEFLASVFTGEHTFFGMRPFNAHHWMVISDDLFDYREAMMEDCVMRYGLPDHLLRRWRAFHELFRREIVKAKARGIVEDGVERHKEGFSVELIDCGTVCDGCVGEISPGDRVRMHNRTGQVFCMDCGADKAVNEVGAPA